MTSYAGRNLDATVLTALDLAGGIIWQRTFKGHPRPPRITPAGTVWLSHRGPAGHTFTEVGPDGQVLRSVVPEHQAHEHLGAFVLLPDGFCVIWLPASPRRQALPGQAPRVARHTQTGAVTWSTPLPPADTEARWERARLLLHDDTIDTELRVAGLLVLLYAQQPASISRLTLDCLQITSDTIRLRLGREPIVLPEPLAGLVRDLASTRRGHAVIGAPGTSPWLFPGGQPGRPISPFQLTKRLRDLGLNPAQSRSTALFELATELPAAILARMLGIHISVAAAWQRASAGDWTTYAAVVSRRQPLDAARKP